MDEFLDMEAEPSDSGNSDDDDTYNNDDTVLGMLPRLPEVMMLPSEVHFLSVVGPPEVSQLKRRSQPTNNDNS